MFENYEIAFALIIIYILIVVTVIVLANKKGLDFGRWLFYGVFSHVFALLFVLLKKERNSTMSKEQGVRP